MKFKIVTKTYRYAGRDIIVIKTADGRRQGFYRSSGRNSGMPGVWCPFNGISLFPFLWFDKEEFCHKSLEEIGLDRFGTAEWKEVSEALGKMDIVPGKDKTPRQINYLLGTEKSRRHNYLPKYLNAAR